MVLPEISCTATRSPTATSSSQMNDQVSEPSIGTEKRISPRRSPSGTRVTMAVSPSITSRPMPEVVISVIRGLSTLNQKSTNATEAIIQTRTCKVRLRPGTTSNNTPTTSAPKPNQKIVKEGTASSSNISIIPKTSQYQKSI